MNFKTVNFRMWIHKGLMYDKLILENLIFGHLFDNVTICLYIFPLSFEIFHTIKLYTCIYMLKGPGIINSKSLEFYGISSLISLVYSN